MFFIFTSFLNATFLFAGTDSLVFKCIFVFIVIKQTEFMLKFLFPPWFLIHRYVSLKNLPSLRKKKRKFFKSTIFMSEITLRNVSKKFKKKSFYKQTLFQWYWLPRRKIYGVWEKGEGQKPGAWVKPQGVWGRHQSMQWKPQFNECLGWPGVCRWLSSACGKPYESNPTLHPTSTTPDTGHFLCLLWTAMKTVLPQTPVDKLGFGSN